MPALHTWTESELATMEQIVKRLQILSPAEMDVQSIQQVLAETALYLSLNLRSVMKTFRLAITGVEMGAPIVQTAVVLGYKECLSRVGHQFPKRINSC